MTQYSDHVFTISSTGVINVYKVDEKVDQGIQLKATIEAIDWEKLVEKRIEKVKQAWKDKKYDNNFDVNNSLPQSLKFHHIQKGYFELMDDDQLMLFCNGEVLIGLDIRTLKATLLSEEKTIQVETTTKGEYEKVGRGESDKKDKNEEEKSVYYTSEDGGSDEDIQDQDINHDQDDQPDGKPNLNVQQNQTQQISNSSSKPSNSDYFIPLSIPNSNYTILLNRQYQPLQNFQSVTKIDENHFAVLDNTKGVILYKINKSPQALNQPEINYEIQKIQTIDKQVFGMIYYRNENINLVEIKFIKEKGLLLVLDHGKGVFAFDKQEFETTNNQNHPIFTLNPNIILKKQCNLMEYSSFSQSLYLACSKIYRISLARWPLIYQKTYMHPMINIRQIYPLEEQNILVFAGFSSLKLLYLDRQAEYFEDEMLDKILFSGGNRAVTANEYAILVYNYQVEKPVITCQANDVSLSGVHNVVLRTTAECQQEFLNSINRTKQMKSIYEPEDVCIYTLYKTLYIWEQGELPETSIALFFILFALLCILMFLWIIFTIWRSKRAANYLKTLLPTTHTSLVEEISYKSQKSVSSNQVNISYHPETGESINKIGDSLSTDKQSEQKL